VIDDGLVIAATRFAAALQPQSAHPAPRESGLLRADEVIE
jgi:hypothetical protein